MNRLAIGLLALAAFLAPIYGGQLPVATLPGSPDLLTLREAQHSSVAHFVIGLFAALAYLLSLISNKVVQAPTPKVFAPLVIFAGALTLSLGTTDFKFLTLRALGEWLSYIMVVFAAVAIVGRGRGVTAVLGAFAAGCTVVAADGILEYSGMRAIDPTWRIFAGWINPNALAGLLCMGFVVALSLVHSAERVLKALPLAASTLIGLALLLTQSKGGYLATAVGTLVVFGAMLFWVKERKSLAPLILPILLVPCLGMAIRSAAAKPGTAVGSRVESAGGTAEQSVGYRQLLWKGAAKVTAENPFGLGLGTYNVESGRSGLHEPTYLAHQSYLQVAQEAGWLGIAALIWLAGAWLIGICRGATKLVPARASLLAGTLGAAVASGVHNCIDSGWYHYGIGISFFLLLGVGLQLAADGSSPEYFPAKFRSIAGYGAVCLVLALLGFAANSEVAKSAFLANPTPGSAAALTSRTALDDEAWILSSRLHPKGEAEALATACQLGPSPKNFRRFARFLQPTDTARASEALTEALKRGPSNLQTLRVLMNLQLQQGSTNAEATYRRILDVEKTSYYQTRAVPELVVTDTAEARLDWIDAHGSIDDAATLQAAVDILLNYAKVTAPMIVDAVKKTGQPYAGETLEDVQEKMARAQKAAQNLAGIYRKFGEEDRAKAADEAAEVFTGFGA